MDGFDNDFESAAPAANAEVDPAAEFLANEQRELADLSEDLDLTAQPPQVQETEPAALSASPISNGHEVQALGVSDEAPDATDVDDIFQVLGEEESQPNAGDSGMNPFGSPMLSVSQDSLSKEFSRIEVRTEEPECIKKWKVEQEERLKAKDAEEEEKKNELREKAKKELEDWYKRYEEQLAKTKETNRSAQEELVTEMNNIVPGTEWERVAKHCDFNPKSTRHTKDVSRMRSLLLQLKQNPPSRE